MIMKCILCDEEAFVKKTRYHKGTVVRIRECKECLTRFETQEKVNYGKLDRYTLNKLHEKAEGRLVR